MKDFSLESKTQTLLDSVKWDDKGLAVAIAQNVDTETILMQGFANRVAVLTTISSRKAIFYSRSRSTLWTKGETSMNFINIHDIFLDWVRDSIIYLGKPDGPNNLPYRVEGNKLALSTLYSLESTISQRKAELAEEEYGKSSWTKRLLKHNDLLCSKMIREEAEELCKTLVENEDKSRTASRWRMSSIMPCMVLLAVKDVRIEDVMQVLRQIFSQSGIEEKKSRISQS